MLSPTDTSGRRLALLIATSDYDDPALRQLRSPGQDARDLANVLADPQIGDFEVQNIVNASCSVLQDQILDFCSDRSPGDQLLIYLSCHGLLDDNGRLYYAAVNTRRLRLPSSAVSAAWLNDRLDESRARRQILMLDCCHSGAFDSRSKGEPSLALQHRFEPHGRGRVVLTASRSTEYSFEESQPAGSGVPSVFTKVVIEGLSTGDADRDKDGLITVNDLYHHVYETIHAREPRQTPELWTYGAEGELLVARSIRGAVIEPQPLSEDLRDMLDNSKSRVRERAVAELAELLDTADPRLALTARQALERIANEDIPRVASPARVALDAPLGAARAQVHSQLAKQAVEQARHDRDARPKEPDPPPGPPPPPPPPPPIPPPIPENRSWEIWHVLASRVRFWLGLVLILAGAIPLIKNVQHYYGYEKYPSVANLHLYIELGLAALIVTGVILVGIAAFSAWAVPRHRSGETATRPPPGG